MLCALVVSSKTWYDKAVFNVDFSERLPSYNLAHINTMESEFLSALDYRATVSLSLYAKCARLEPHAPGLLATVPATLFLFFGQATQIY